jgi:hypothetical protein
VGTEKYYRLKFFLDNGRLYCDNRGQSLFQLPIGILYLTVLDLWDHQ